MKLALTADWHIANHKRQGGALIRGINRRGQHCLDVAQKAVQAAQGPLIVAGDLIDDAGPIQPQLAAALRKTIHKASGGARIILGNHDMTSTDDHSLDLYEGPNFQLEGHPYRIVTGIDFAYDEWFQPQAILVPFHCDMRDERVRDVPLVVAHFGVYDDNFPKWCRNDKKAWHVNDLFAFMQERNIDIILAGDWHGRQTWIDDCSRRMGKILEQSGQKWSFDLSNPMLDLEWLEERRIWRFRHRQASCTEISSEVSGICSAVGEHQRTLSQNYAIGSLMQKPSLSQAGPPRASYAEREFAAQRKQFSQECQENSLQERASFLSGEHSICEKQLRDEPSMSYMSSCSRTCSNSESQSPQKRSKVIGQIGALIATGWDNPGMHGYGTVAHWDGERLSWQELPGPRFCTAHTADEEAALIAEAARLGHKLYLRRFYENERPPTPEGVEAYEALPITLEKAVLIAATQAGFSDPQAELNALMQDWLNQWENDRNALEAHIKRYV